MLEKYGYISGKQWFSLGFLWVFDSKFSPKKMNIYTSDCYKFIN